MILTQEQYLRHYGTPRHSGRYPWGSGGNSETHATRNRDFLDAIDMCRKQGMTDKQIADGFGITTTQLRAATSIASTQRRLDKIGQAQRLHDTGMSNIAIGREMGINESSVRALLAPGAKDKADVLQTTANMLKEQVEKKNYVDVGTGVENQIGISQTKLKTAVAMLQQEGYKVHYVKVQQVTTGHQTTIKVLSKPDVPYSEVYKNRGLIQQVTDHTNDGGRNFESPTRPVNIDSKRVAIRYKEDGGDKEDGVIYLRPNVDDLNMGSSRYAQVRIAVDGTHYLKGMAIYKDDLPPGVDVVFNTNKSNTGRKKDAMKEMETRPDGKPDLDNPFGAQIKAGGQRGALNIVNEEGDWDTWSKTISSQVLSKQHPSLAENQLNMTYERRQTELDDIRRLTNPAVRKDLLLKFADETDSAAVHLKAAALPGQATKVILPLRSIKENEIYAPTFADGTRVALIRFPHAGTFEIPQLTVNNRNPEAKKVLGVNPRPADAVGIHYKTAEHLSGADFDGDHVLVIPNNKGSIKSTPALEGLKDFDPQTYKIPEGSGIPKITSSRKQQEMGKITNLIADMTIRGANSDELARAVRHSMVVIDSEKHGLDFKRSEKDNGIAALKEKYQGSARAGASTLITKAGSEARPVRRKPRPAALGGPIDPVTGKKVYVPTGEEYVNAKGQTVTKTFKSKKLAETDDARSLLSDAAAPIEVVYAEHSNKLKAMANEARKESLATTPTTWSKSAKAAYAEQVASLDAKLNTAKKNAPLERQAQVIANVQVSQRRQANPDMDESDIKKIKNQALTEARLRTGAAKERIKPTQSEWDAIQAGAISNSKLEDILRNADAATVRELATPRVHVLMTPTKKSRAVAMQAQGYTQAEIAQQLGVSLSTLKASIDQ